MSALARIVTCRIPAVLWACFAVLALVPMPAGAQKFDVPGFIGEGGPVIQVMLPWSVEVIGWSLNESQVSRPKNALAVVVRCAYVDVGLSGPAMCMTTWINFSAKPEKFEGDASLWAAISTDASQVLRWTKDEVVAVRETGCWKMIWTIRADAATYERIPKSRAEIPQGQQCSPTLQIIRERVVDRDTFMKWFSTAPKTTQAPSGAPEQRRPRP